jgi:hypothetical protein
MFSGAGPNMWLDVLLGTATDRADEIRHRVYIWAEQALDRLALDNPWHGACDSGFFANGLASNICMVRCTAIEGGEWFSQFPQSMPQNAFGALSRECFGHLQLPHAALKSVLPRAIASVLQAAEQRIGDTMPMDAMLSNTPSAARPELLKAYDELVMGRAANAMLQVKPGAATDVATAVAASLGRAAASAAESCEGVLGALRTALAMLGCVGSVADYLLLIGYFLRHASAASGRAA